MVPNLDLLGGHWGFHPHSRNDPYLPAYCPIFTPIVAGSPWFTDRPTPMAGDQIRTGWQGLAMGWGNLAGVYTDGTRQATSVDFSRTAFEIVAWFHRI